MNKLLKKVFIYLFIFSPLISYYIKITTSFRPYHVFGSLIVVFFVYVFFEKRGNVKVPKYLIPLYFYVLYLFIWDIVNGYIFKRGLDYFLFNNNQFHTIFLILLIENTEFNSRDIKQIYSAIKILFVLTFAGSIVEYFSPTIFKAGFVTSDQSYSIYKDRRMSIFTALDNNGIGRSFIPLVSLYLGFTIKNNKLNETYKYVIMAGIVALLSNARYILLIYVVILLQYFVYYKFQLGAVLKYAVITVLIIFISFMTLDFLGYEWAEFQEERLLSRSASSRLLAVQLFVNFFPDQPVFGTGVHKTDELINALAGRSSQIHVGYLSHFFSYGIIGSLLLFLFWYLVVKRFWYVGKKTGNYGIFFAFFTFLIANLTLVEYSFYTFGIIMAFIYYKYYKTSIVKALVVKNG